MTSLTVNDRPFSHDSSWSSSAYRVVGSLFLLDLLVLPYFPLFVMPLSLVFVVMWAILRLEIRIGRELRLFFVIVACVTISAGLTVFYRERPIVVENLKRAGQLVTSFSYYFFLRRAARDPQFNPTGVLTAFLVFFAAWTTFFLTSPEAALFAASRIYRVSGEVIQWNLAYLRFSYMYSDPNSAGYLVAMVGVFLLRFGRLGTLRTAVVLLATVGGVAVTGSRGAALALLLALAIAAWRTKLISRYFVRFAGAAVIMVLVVAGAVSFWDADPNQRYNLTRVYDSALTRITGAGRQSLREVMLEGETSAGASRLFTYREAVTRFWPLPAGRGYELTGRYPSFRPHSDILRILYGYGFIALIAIWIFFFRDAWRLEFAIPALMAFAVNTLIDEQKLLSTFLALLAIARVQIGRMLKEPAHIRRGA